jgi:phosphoglycerol transferase
LAESDQIRLFTFFVFACLLAMTTLFTANVAGSNAMESIARLHMRYYNFALPLLLVVVAGQVSPPVARPGMRGAVPAVVFGVLAILAITSLLDGFVPGIVDSPELRGLTINPVMFRTLAMLGVLTLVAWVFNARIGSRLFLFVLFPIVVVVSSWRGNGELRQNMVADSYASAGIFTHQYIGRSVEPILVVGADHSASYRAMFYLDNPNATNLVVPEGEALTESQLPANARWLLVVGEHALPASARQEAAFGGFTLARLGPDVQSIDFTAGSWPGVISSKQGLSSPEPWGTWSDGTRVVLRFSKPLPREFTLVLKGHTIGDTNEPIGVVVGPERREVHLPKPQELALDFSTDGNQTSVTFEVPWARSMKELGISEDPRRLGIGFVSLQITARQSASHAAAAPAEAPAEAPVHQP